MSHKGVPNLNHQTKRAGGDIRWQERAGCRDTDPEAFFPDQGNVITLGARRVCGNCEVRSECLEYALSHKEWHGIWGGLSVEQRRDLQRHRIASRVHA